VGALHRRLSIAARETRVLGFPLGVRRDAATTAEVGSNTLKGDEIACLPHYSVGEVRGAPSKRPPDILALLDVFAISPTSSYNSAVTARKSREDGRIAVLVKGTTLGVTVLPSTTAANGIGIL